MRVLVIEDYAPIRESVSARLRELGFSVSEAVDGEEGLWLAQHEPHDVIVLDIMLPKLDGLELLQRLRKGGKDALVLILTAKDELDDRIMGLDSGADDYLTKPFALAELVSRIKALLRRRHGFRHPTIEEGSIQIDLNTRKVMREGQELKLTGREYSILELLALRRGQILTRTEIWEAVYDPEAELTSNSVDVHISQLRKKLSVEGESALIQTRRGLGYVFESKSK